MKNTFAINLAPIQWRTNTRKASSSDGSSKINSKRLQSKLVPSGSFAGLPWQTLETDTLRAALISDASSLKTFDKLAALCELKRRGVSVKNFNTDR